MPAEGRWDLTRRLKGEIAAHVLWKMSVLFEQKKMKFWNKQRVVENKTDYAACL